MRLAIKFLHTLASCGLIGALLGYMFVLVYMVQDTPAAYADMRRMISLISSYVLLPSLGIALVTGIVSMVVHKAFLDTRWAWLKAVFGLSMFEATLAIVQAKANAAAQEADKIRDGGGEAGLLAEIIANEWLALGIIMALSIAQIALGVWRPRFARRVR